jgi:ubiquinone/menaquinone biosynthesis C-methylase UbiE
LNRDPRERFTAAADLYHRHRPSYPAALIDWILTTASLVPPAKVADIGCGTGISTRLLADRGFDVVGVDPNEEMLARARDAAGARYQKGEAAATGLPDRSVDLVTVAQAFHWFDVPRALAEIARILRPGRWSAAFWNVRALTTAFMVEYDELLRRYSHEYAILESHEQAGRRIAASPGVLDLREAEFASAQRLGLESFLGRVYSSSYVIHGVEDRDVFARALGDLFDRHQKSGIVELRYRTVGLCWRVRASQPGSSAPGPARD